NNTNGHGHGPGPGPGHHVTPTSNHTNHRTFKLYVGCCNQQWSHETKSRINAGLMINCIILAVFGVITLLIWTAGYVVQVKNTEYYSQDPSICVITGYEITAATC